MTDDAVHTVDMAALAERVDEANLILRVDAGGIEVVSVDKAGVVAIRYTGMCVACMSKPLTTASTIRPLLLQVPGVTDVFATGARISEEGQRGIVASIRRAAAAAAARAEKEADSR